MPTLNLRGTRELSSDTAGIFSYDGSVFGTLERVPKWWDKKQSPMMIWVNRVHITRSCGDIDLLVPKSYDLDLKIRYDGDVGFIFDRYKSVERVGITDPGSNEVLEEYIMPNHPGRAVRKRIFGNLISCLSALDVVGFYAYYSEEGPNMDCGDLSPSDAHYDLNVGDRNFDLN